MNSKIIEEKLALNTKHTTKENNFKVTSRKIAEGNFLKDIFCARKPGCQNETRILNEDKKDTSMEKIIDMLQYLLKMLLECQNIYFKTCGEFYNIYRV